MGTIARDPLRPAGARAPQPGRDLRTHEAAQHGGDLPRPGGQVPSEEFVGQLGRPGPSYAAGGARVCEEDGVRQSGCAKWVEAGRLKGVGERETRRRMIFVSFSLSSSTSFRFP
jgi:hypothetical protein